MTFETPAHDPSCDEQLRIAVADLYRRASSILGEQCEATPEHTSTWLGITLRGEDGSTYDGESLAVMCAYQVVKDLVDRADTDNPEWWGTPLGRTVTWWVGWPGDPKQSVKIVPPPVVRHVLGITRQAAFQRGDMYSDELRRALRERWPSIQMARRLALVK